MLSSKRASAFSSDVACGSSSFLRNASKCIVNSPRKETFTPKLFENVKCRANQRNLPVGKFVNAEAIYDCLPKYDHEIGPLRQRLHGDLFPRSFSSTSIATPRRVRAAYLLKPSG